MSSGKYVAPSWIALAGMLVYAGVVVASNARSTGDGAVLRMQIIDGDTTTESTCFLVHKEQRQCDVVYYFLTSAHVLDTEATAERGSASRRIRVIIGDAIAIEAGGTDVLFPARAEQGLDLAIVKAVSADRDLAAVPISMELPDPGQVFVIRRFAGNGLPLLAERVRSRSARFVVGDRTAADVSGLVGAPAMVEDGVFGLVSDWDPSRVPVITLLSAARGFLSRAIPGWTSTASATPAFTLEQRLIAGPSLQVACDAIKSGDVDIPMTLGPRETAVDATATFTDPRSLHLGDITVLSLQDQLVKLRFTMMGVRPPPFPGACPQGQALVTVGVNVVVMSRR